MPLDALLLDLDGTLLDSVWLHARAYDRALQTVGLRVPVRQVAQAVGRSGAFLAPSLIGQEAYEEHGETLSRVKAEAFEALLDAEGAAALDGAEAFLRVLQERGVRTALVTGSKEDALAHLCRVSGLDVPSLVDEVVDGSYDALGKPAPDALLAACEALGVTPAQAALVDDTPHGALAAWRAGVACLGISSDLHDAAALRQAGCRAAYASPADLLENLDEAFELVSTGPLRLDAERLDALMDEALEEAKRGMEAGEVPIGAVVVGPDGEVVARAHHMGQGRDSRLAHAELLALQEAEPLAEARHSILVTTLEPCPMCLGAAMAAGIGTIVYALEAPANGSVERVEPIRTPGAVVPRLVGRVRRSASRDLLVRWQEEGGSDFVAQLLEETA